MSDLETSEHSEGDNGPYDFTLTVGDQTIMAHKCVLAESSPYFRAMISNDCKESRESNALIHQIEYEIVSMIINYFYQGEIDVNPLNVFSLLEAACMMQSLPIQQKCIDHLKQELDPSNCVETFVAADKFHLEELTQLAEKYILRNFFLLDHDRIAILSLEQIIDILKDEEIVINSEYEIFEAAKVWASHNKMEEKMADLIELVRLPQMSILCLMKISNDPIIRSNTRCQEYLYKVRSFCYYPYDISTISTVKNKRLLHARESSQTCLYYFGGGKPTMRYDPRVDQWFETNLAIVRNQNFALTVWNNVIYFAGGYPRGSYAACYNFRSNMMIEMPCLSECRSSPAIITLKGNPYVIGGSGTLTTGEFFQPARNSWIKRRDLNIPRRYFTLITLNDITYAIGGTTPDRPICNHVERLERLFTWKQVASMKHARRSHGCAAFNGFIYVAGGFKTEYDRTDTCERYDPRNDKWEEIAKMPKARAYHSLVVLGELIFAVGGEFDNTKCDQLDIYDPANNVWDTRPTWKIDYFGGAVAIRGLNA